MERPKVTLMIMPSKSWSLVLIVRIERGPCLFGQKRGPYSMMVNDSIHLALLTLEALWSWSPLEDVGVDVWRLSFVCESLWIGQNWKKKMTLLELMVTVFSNSSSHFQNFPLEVLKARLLPRLILEEVALKADPRGCRQVAQRELLPHPVTTAQKWTSGAVSWHMSRKWLLLLQSPSQRASTSPHSSLPIKCLEVLETAWTQRRGQGIRPMTWSIPCNGHRGATMASREVSERLLQMGTNLQIG